MSVKKEYRIDSSDSARPPVSMDSQPHFNLQMGYKPEEKELVDIVYEDSGQVVDTKTGDQVQVINVTRIYANGDIAESNCGAKNPAYLEYLRTGVALPAKKVGTSTTSREPSDAVKAAMAKASGNKPAPKKTTKKED